MDSDTNRTGSPWLASVRADMARLDGIGVTDAERVDQIARLEELKNAAAAAQARLAAAFLDSRVPDRSRREQAVAMRSVKAEVALARRESPSLGERHVGLARALVGELPATLAAMTAGQVSEYAAILVCQQTATVSLADRLEVDARLVPDLGRLGPRQLAAAASRIAAELDAASVVARHSAAVASRRVSLRPAPDGMAYLTVLGPLVDTVGAYAALRGHASSVTAGHGTESVGGRGLGQLMADAALERLSGRSAGESQQVAVMTVVTKADLVHAGPGVAHLPGYGDVPFDTVRSAVAVSAAPGDVAHLLASDDGRAVAVGQVSKLAMVQPAGTQVSASRTFRGQLGLTVDLRDQVCRTPFCEAPIRHRDHVHRVADGGRTMLANGQGTCACCNLVKETPGWRSVVTADGLDPGGPAHTVVITTPTGHTYQSTAPPVMGWGWLPAPSTAGRVHSTIELVRAIRLRLRAADDRRADRTEALRVSLTRMTAA